MQTSKFPGRELLCINTEKVFDWVLNEATFQLSFTDVDLPFDGEEPIDCPDPSDVTCEVEAANPVEVGPRKTKTFIIDGKKVKLQVVKLRKDITVTFIFPTATGGTATASFERMLFENVVLCAPDDTDIEATTTAVDCEVNSFTCDEEFGEFSAQVTVTLCQSIQSTFPVTLEIEADFCKPRSAILPINICPPLTIPKQCPAIFPDHHDDDHDDDCDDDKE